MRSYLLVITEDGRAKLTEAACIARPVRGKPGVRFLHSDACPPVAILGFTDDPDLHVAVLTEQGKAVCFPLTLLYSMGRDTRGVRAIALNEGDRVVSAAIVPIAPENLL